MHQAPLHERLRKDFPASFENRARTKVEAAIPLGLLPTVMSAASNATDGLPKISPEKNQKEEERKPFEPIELSYSDYYVGASVFTGILLILTIFYGPSLVGVGVAGGAVYLFNTWKKFKVAVSLFEGARKIFKAWKASGRVEQEKKRRTKQGLV